MPATNRTSSASAIALPVSGMELLQSFKEGATLDGPRFLRRDLVPFRCLAAACLAAAFAAAARLAAACLAAAFASAPYFPA